MVASLLTPLTSGIQDYRLFSTKTMGKFVNQWKKTTRFTTQWHRIECNSVPTFGKTVTIDIPTKGHLVGRIYFVTEVPAIPENLNPKFKYVNSVGHTLIEDLQVNIGGTVVDRIDSRLLEVLDEFNTPIEKVDTVSRLIKRGNSAGSAGNIYVHLPFWFSSNDPHLWYPIDAVNVDRLRIQMQIRRFTDIVESDEGEGGENLYYPDCSGLSVSSGTGTGTGGAEPVEPTDIGSTLGLALGDSYLLAEYIYLDTPEANRLRVANIQIPILQHTIIPYHTTDVGATVSRVKLRIGNPMKSLFFFAQRTDAEEINNYFNSSTLKYYQATRNGETKRRNEPIRSVALMYQNAQVRYQTSFMDTFRLLMPSIECTKAPAFSNYFYYMGFDIGNHERRPGIPCGEANMDRIGSAELALELRPTADKVAYNIFMYAMTYNILNIYGGRAGLLFAY
jgi:hypothetical protein